MSACERSKGFCLTGRPTTYDPKREVVIAVCHELAVVVDRDRGWTDNRSSQRARIKLEWMTTPPRCRTWIASLEENVGLNDVRESAERQVRTLRRAMGLSEPSRDPGDDFMWDQFHESFRR